MLKYIIPCLFLFISGSLYAQKEHLPSREARRYFNEAFTYIEDTYYFTYKIKWNKLRKEVLPLLADAKTKQDTYPAIKYVLDHLYDKHSGFWPPPGAPSGKRPDSIYHFNASMPPGFPVCYITPEGIGYLFIPSNFYLPYDEKKLQQWTDSLLYPIFRFDEKGINGWIIDLRFNSGGYMNPMLNGVAPLIGKGYLYTLTDKFGRDKNYNITRGEINLKKPGLPIAVLTSPFTASAAEFTALALHSYDHVRFFGDSTRGMSTGMKLTYLSDSAMLNVTNQVCSDRHGIKYLGKLPPDVLIRGRQLYRGDSTTKVATRWILQKD